MLLQEEVPWSGGYGDGYGLSGGSWWTDRGPDGPVPKGTWLLYESPERGDPLGFSEFPSKEELDLVLAVRGLAVGKEPAARQLAWALEFPVVPV